jgi:hypothetical protein
MYDDDELVGWNAPLPPSAAEVEAVPAEPQPENAEAPNTASSRCLARLLTDAGILAEADILRVEKQFPNEYLGDVLVREKVLLPDYLSSLLIRELRIPWFDAANYMVSPEVAALLPEAFCRRHRVMPVSEVKNFLTIVCVNPLDEPLFNDIQGRTGLNVRPVLSTSEQVEQLIDLVFAKPEAEGEADQEPAAEEEGEAAPIQSIADKLAAELVQQAESEDRNEAGKDNDGN